MNFLAKTALSIACAGLGAAAFAQTAGDRPASAIELPADGDFLIDADPSVRRATAIVNGDVITGTDVDHRLALLLLGSNRALTADEQRILRGRILRELIDETLQIQAAAASDIKVEDRMVENQFARQAEGLGQTPAQFADFLRANGSSAESMKRQIRGEIAWLLLQRRQIEPFVAVSDEEVQSMIDRLEADRGTQEFRIAEIFISSGPQGGDEARTNATRIAEQLRQGASFAAFASQFSEASTAAVGGDLGWIRAEQLPAPLAQAAHTLPVGQISDPIAVPGGYSIILVQDTRQVLTPDPRDAELSLMQLSIALPPDVTRAEAEAAVNRLAQTGRTMGGCGRAEEAAARIGAEVVSNDGIKVRDLPRPLQNALLQLDIGQATMPFGSIQDGVRILVLCGRDDPELDQTPSFEQIAEALSEERVNRRARHYLRDLRRDAVVEYRTDIVSNR